MVAVNLLPWRAWQLRRQRRLWLQITLALLLLLLMAAALLVKIYRVQCETLASQNAGLTLQIKGMDALLAQQKAVHQQIEQLEARWQQRQHVKQQLQAWHQFWMRLPDLLPATLWLTRLEKRDGLLELEGRAHTVQAVRDFRLQLAALPLFSSVRQGPLRREPEGNYRFVLRARLQEA
ncbi:PilN domain-containing protein [[Erwinia] mediterraneensis]|uniref:PilN domain-containing protein n=1 Tax=[Erwinia] mediterraneensis TaxID=2161819 RepID=UPI001030D4BC|nr:PilN domain-containing protein [[Erwinia] mediterraneensis]